MNNSAVHQSLIDIEENLQKLESARTQVSRVTESSEKLIISVSKLVENFDALQREFGNEKSRLNDSMNYSLNSFVGSLENTSKRALANSAKLTKEQQNSFEETLSKIDAFTKTIKDAERTINELDFKKEINALSERIGNISTDLTKTREGLSKKIDSHYKEWERLQNNNSKKLMFLNLVIGLMILLTIFFKS